MSSNNQNQRLNGMGVLSYQGQNPHQPTNFTTSTTSPTTDDSRGFNLGDWWLNVSNSSIWYLAATNGLIATWIQVQGSGTGLLALEGNFGGEVFPLNSNINVVGDGVTVSISGNPGTSTLTMTSLGGGTDLSLTGNTGGAVSETAGNINLVGTGSITVSGNPGTSTLTVSTSGATVTSYATQAGTAIPVANVLNIVGSNSISTSGSGSTATIAAASNIAQSYITSPATGTATPAAGVLTFAAGSGATISASGSTVTVTSSASGALPTYATGTFTPALAFGGNTGGITYNNRLAWYTRMGNMVFINIYIAPIFPSPSGSGTATIGGLPYTVSSSYGSLFQETSGWTIISQTTAGTPRVSDNQYVWGRFTPGTTSMTLYYQLVNLSGSSAAILTRARLTYGAWPYIVIQAFYYVD